MAFCRYCGASLAEGQTCTCPQSQAGQQSTPVQQPVYQQPVYQQPAQPQQPSAAQQQAAATAQAAQAGGLWAAAQGLCYRFADRHDGGGRLWLL